MEHFELRALIFDMDGVLIDSEPMHFQAFQKFFEGHGLDYTAEQNALYLGRKDMEIAADLIDQYALKMSAEEVVEQKEEIFQKLVRSNAIPREGVVETLKKAKAMNVESALASSATMPSIKLIVDTLSLNDFFHNLTSGDEVKHGKPAPDVFLLAAERMRVDPQHCLVIEDTEAGVEAAKAAGMKVVAIPCEATRHQLHRRADLKVDSLRELNLQEWVRNWRAATP